MLRGMESHLAARVGREDAPSEGPDDPPVPPVPGFRGLARDRVEVDDREAFFPKGRCDGGLPAGDAAGEAHDVHRREPPGSPPGSKCCARSRTPAKTGLKNNSVTMGPLD